MKKFTVELEWRATYSIDVEASTEEEAETKAKELWRKSEDPFGDFNGYGHGLTAEGITELDG